MLVFNNKANNTDYAVSLTAEITKNESGDLVYPMVPLAGNHNCVLRSSGDDFIHCTREQLLEDFDFFNYEQFKLKVEIKSSYCSFIGPLGWVTDPVVEIDLPVGYGGFPNMEAYIKNSLNSIADSFAAAPLENISGFEDLAEATGEVLINLFKELSGNLDIVATPIRTISSQLASVTMTICTKSPSDRMGRLVS